MHVIYTNNAIVAEYFEQNDATIEVKFLAAPAIDVLTAVKSVARSGAVVLSNPMAGIRTSQQLFGPQGFELSGRSAASAPKIRSINPYLSVLVAASEGSTVHFESIKSLDEAHAVYKKNARLRFAAHSDDNIKSFQASDLETLIATMAVLKVVK